MRLLLTPMLSEDFMFVDYLGLDNRTGVAGSDSLPRCVLFRQNIVQRDGHCVVTGDDKSHCDATHIIPRSKGNVVAFIIGFM